MPYALVQKFLEVIRKKVSKRDEIEACTFTLGVVEDNVLHKMATEQIRQIFRAVLGFQELCI